jgi:hypothetical protein
MRTDDHPVAGGEAPASSLAHRFTAALAAKDAMISHRTVAARARTATGL